MLVIVTREIDIGRVRGAAGTDRAPYATGPGWSLIAHIGERTELQQECCRASCRVCMGM
jgi:hypothetical protein